MIDIKFGKISDKSDNVKGVIVEVIIKGEGSLSDKEVKGLIKTNIDDFIGSDSDLKENVFDYLLDNGLFGGSRKDMEKGLEAHNEEEGESFEFEDYENSLWDDFDLSLEGVNIIENKKDEVKVELTVRDAILRELNKEKKKDIGR